MLLWVRISAEILDIGWVAPAGSMYSTAIDLAKFLIFLLNADPPLISSASVREWTNSRTTFPDGKSGFALPWELLIINATGKEFLVTKSGAIGSFLSIIAIHPQTQLGFSAVISYNDSLLTGLDALMADVFNYLIPLVEQETTKILDPLYNGHYVCDQTPPTHNEALNSTIEILGGFIDITNSPSLGLSAFTNISLIVDGQPREQLRVLRMLLKNSTENSFWVGFSSDCAGFFELISGIPSKTHPNYPGTIYDLEFKFEFANKTVEWPAFGVYCAKK